MLSRSICFIVTFALFSFSQIGIIANVLADETDPVVYESFPQLIPEINNFTGAALQRIPIAVPPGRSGVEPELKFTYNSYKKNQWMGVGWRLEIDAIQRSAKNGVHYGRDEYVLLSQGKNVDLVSIGGDNFRAKIETDFQQYYYDRAQNHWRITRKDGTKLYFGKQSDTNALQTNVHGTFRWSLDRIEDTNGNYLNIYYQQDQGTLYPDYIEYTGNMITGDQPYNLIKFEYEPANLAIVSYQARDRAVTAQRLRAVKTFANGNPMAQVLGYHMEYEDSPHGGQERLKKIRISGSEGLSELPGYTFTYKDGQIPTTWGGTIINDLLSEGDYYLSDLNGDNKDDFIIIKDNLKDPATSFTVFWGNGDGTFAEPAQVSGVASNIPLQQFPVSSYIKEKGGYFTDLNNDTRADYVRLYEVWHAGENDFFDHSRIDLSLCGEDGRFNFSQTLIRFTPFVTGTNMPVAFLDLNNDGHMDFYAGNHYLNDGSGLFSQGAASGLYFYPASGGGQKFYIVDVNGDGQSDIVNFYYESWGLLVGHDWRLSTYFGNGSAEFNLAKQLDRDDIDLAYSSISFNDVNGDQRADLIVMKSSGQVAGQVSQRDRIVYLSDGNGGYDYLETRYFDSCGTGASCSGDMIFGDLNGDGHTDHVNADYMETEETNGDITVVRNTLRTSVSQGALPFDLLNTASSPSGVKISYDYRMSAQVPEQHILPFNLYTVKELSVDDGVSGEDSVNTYLHQWGYYDAAWKEFRGFELSTRTQPDNSVTKSYYYVGHEETPIPVCIDGAMHAPEDSDYYKGRPRRVERYDAPGGNMLSATTYTWDKVEDASYPWAFVKMTQEHTEYYDDQTVDTQKLYVYDDTNGNLDLVTASGTDALPIVTDYDYTNYSGDAWNPLWRQTMEKRYYLGQENSPDRHTDFIHDSSTGNLKEKIQRKENADSVWSFHYYGNGNLRVELDAEGNPPTIYDTYDATQTYPTIIKNPLGHETRKAWDARYGKEIWIQDQNGINNGFRTDFAYDNFGRLQRTDFPDGGYTILEFNDYCTDANCTNVTLPRKVTRKVRTVGADTEDTVFYFDGLGRKAQSIQRGQGGNYIVHKDHFDKMGRKEFTAGPLFQPLDAFLTWQHDREHGYSGLLGFEYPYVFTTFDKRGRPTFVYTPGGPNPEMSVTEYQYSGFATKIIDPDDCAKTEVRDHLERIIRVIDHAETGDINTNYVYNAAGDLEEVRNHFWSESSPDENRILMRYDTKGQKEYMDDSDMGQWSYQYDLNSNMTLQTDAKGDRIQFVHDELNRIKFKYYLDTDEPTVVYNYDNNGDLPANGIGRLYSMSNGDVTTVHSAYDQMGRPNEMRKTIVGQALRTTTHDYDFAGKVTRLTYPHTDASNQFYVEYDFYPRTSLLDKATGSDGTVYADLGNYKPSGKIGDIEFGNNAHTDYGYDDWTGRLTSIYTAAGAGAVAQDRKYYYTPAGDIEIIDDLREVETYYYSYDKLHRLTSETTSTGSVGVIPAIMEMNYDDPDHIHAVSSVLHKGVSHAYNYDPNGNMTNGPDLTDPMAVVDRGLIFNADNMPISVAHPTGGSVQFKYDAQGKRAKKTGIGKETYYFSKEFEIIDGVDTAYIFAGNLRVAKVKPGSGETIYFHKDHLGSSSAITLANGTIKDTAAYMPFGGKRGDKKIVDSDYLFTDQELDVESGLYNYDARLYDPIVGRFVSADSVVPDWYNSQTINRFTYCLNNPIIYQDPDGHYSMRGFSVGPFGSQHANAAFGGLVNGSAQTAKAVVDWSTNPAHLGTIVVGSAVATVSAMKSKSPIAHARALEAIVKGLQAMDDLCQACHGPHKDQESKMNSNVPESKNTPEQSKNKSKTGPDNSDSSGKANSSNTDPETEAPSSDENDEGNENESTNDGVK